MAWQSQLRLITHVLVIATVVTIVIAIFDGTLFSWHPVMMSIGFLGLMTEGVLTSIQFRNLEGNDRLSKIWVHLSWQLASLFCILIGFWAIFQNKVNHGKAHFTSLHSKFGLTTFIGATLAVALGAAGFRKFGVVNKLPERLQPAVKKVHRSIGLIVWLLALVTIELILTHQAVWKGLWSQLWQSGIAVLGAAVVAESYVQRRKKLPVYLNGSKYGIVTAADELTKTS